MKTMVFKHQSKQNRIKIIFMGTPDFAVPSLLALIKNNWNVIAVFTQPDRPIGRQQGLQQPPPVKKLALKYRLACFQPKKIKDEKIIQKIKDLEPDLIVVAAYGLILPKEVLDIPKYGCLNIHASLLPKFRGPSPIQTALLAGEKKTGITLMLMDDKVDHGPILAQKELTIYTKDTGKSLHDRLAQESARFLIKTLPRWISGQIEPRPQNQAKATYCRLLKKEDGHIDWKKSAKQIERKIRALYPWPGTFTFIKIKNKQKRLKITKAKVAARIKSKDKEMKKLVPGRSFLNEQRGTIFVKCGKDYLELVKVQLEGKKEMDVKEFLKGYRHVINTQLL